MNRLFVIASVALATLASQAVMAADADTKGQGGPCRTDIEKLCPGIKPGEGRLKACLREKKDQISPECKKELVAKRKAG
jgi:hypothetical protein